MPVLGCGAEMQRLMDVSDQDVATIEEVISERLALGVGRADAQRQAVAEALAQVAEERDLVMSAVREQLGAEPDAPSEVRASNRTIEVDGRQRPTTNSKGQPIHPTEEGVRNFWRWFGDSKVVDADGRPLVVYHGTTENFDSFNPSLAGAVGDKFASASFFTSSPTIAAGYAQRLSKDAEHAQLFADEDALRDLYGKAVVRQLQETGATSGDISAPAKAAYDAAVEARRARRVAVFSNAVPIDGANIVPVYLRIESPAEIDADGGMYFKTHEKAFDKAKKSDADGVIVRNVIDRANEVMGGASDVFAVFNPTQIKSALGNTGAFNPADPDIRYSKRTIEVDGVQRPTTNSKGQPIHPTEEGVRNFWRWFGDSLVVDDEGRPLVVYHGGQKLTAWNRRGDDSQIYGGHADAVKREYGSSLPAVEKRYLEKPVHFFTDDESVAEGYGDQGAHYEVRSEFLRARNPLDLRLDVVGPKAAAEGMSLAMGEPYEVTGSSYDDSRQMSRALRWDWPSVRERLESAGYDGLVFSDTDVRDRGSHTAYAVFNSNQIKSATGNTGAFNPADPDIRYSKRSGPATWEMPEDSRSERLIYEFVDGRVDLKRAQEAIEKHTGVKDPRFDARTAETLYPGRVANRTDVFLRNEAKPLLEFIAKHNLEMDEVSDYLLARHAPEANAQIAKVNDDLPDGGAGTNSKGVLMTTQAAQDHIKAIPAGKMLLLRKVAALVDDITKGTRDMLVAEGLEQQGMIDAWTGAYKHYVPLFKEEADGAPHPVGKGFTVRGSASKRRTGGKGEVTNILAHVLMQREAVITRAEKNRVLVRLYGLALSNPNPDFWAAIYPAKSAQTIMAELTQLGVDPLSINEMRVAPSIRTVSETTGKVIERTNPFYKDMPGALTLRIGGEDRVLMLNQDDPRALRMATNLKGQDGLIKLDLANMLVGKVTRYLASISTQYNPSFGLVNFLRDAQGAALNLSTTPLAGKQATVLAGAAPAAVAIGRAESDPSFKSPWADLWRQFQADGGQTGYKEMFRDANERMRKIEKEIADAGGGLHPLKAAGMVLRAVDGFNTVMENAVRLSAYKAALDSGLSRDDAALLARELTVDFNRKGRTGRELGPLYAFFNAAAQGTARMLRTLNGPTGRAILAAGFSVGVLQALALAAAGFDDDEIPDYVKARGLIIPIEWGPKAEGGRKYVVIPLALGFNAIPNAGRAITELALTDGKDAKKKLGVVLGELISAFNPLGGGIDILTKEGALRVVLPTVADPLVDLATNKNFKGNPIEKRYDEEKDARPGFQRPTENTQRTATGQVYLGISKAINRATGGSDFEQGEASPSAEKVRYLAQVAGGGLLRDIERLVNIAAPVDGQRDLKASGIPVAGRLYGETDPDQVTRARFSSNRDRLEQLESRLKLMKSAGAGEPIAALYEREKMSSLIDMSNKVQQRLNDLNKQAVRVVNDPEQIKAIDQARVANMRALNDAVLELEQSQAKSKPLGRRLRDAVTAP